MNEGSTDSMLSVVGNALRCELGGKFIFTMPRVVPDQRKKFENDDLFKKLRRESEVTYTGSRDRPIEERRLQLRTDCEKGHAYVAFVATGTNMQLIFLPNSWSDDSDDRRPTREFVDFHSDPEKVYLKSQFIFNGVCVLWKGWLDLYTLTGAGCLEFDQERAQAEDAVLREQNEENVRRGQELDERRLQQQQQQERDLQAASEVEAVVRRKLRHRHLMTCDSLNIFNRHHNALSAKLLTKSAIRHLSSSTSSGNHGRHHHHHHLHQHHHNHNHNRHHRDNHFHSKSSDHRHDNHRHTDNGHEDVKKRIDDQNETCKALDLGQTKALDLGQSSDKPIKIDSEVVDVTSHRSSPRKDDDLEDDENEHVEVEVDNEDEDNDNKVPVPDNSEETDMEVEVDSKSDAEPEPAKEPEPEPEVEVLVDVEEEKPPRDKIRKSDTIWSPWK